MPSFVSAARRPLAIMLLAGAFALPLLLPRPAQAWWLRGGVGWGGVAVAAPPMVVAPPVVIVPRPVVAPPPPVVAYAPPVGRWVPGHYNWRGFWVPGHWV